MNIVIFKKRENNGSRRVLLRKNKVYKLYQHITKTTGMCAFILQKAVDTKNSPRPCLGFIIQHTLSA